MYVLSFATAFNLVDFAQEAVFLDCKVEQYIFSDTNIGTYALVSPLTECPDNVAVSRVILYFFYASAFLLP